MSLIGLTVDRLRTLKKFVKHCVQRVDPARGSFPYELVVDACVAVDQHVPERDNARQIGYLSSRCRIEFAELAQGLADDLELSLDG